MSSEEKALLAGVLAAPGDDNPRKVYADWFTENGQEDRGEFICLQCEIRRLWAAWDDLPGGNAEWFAQYVPYVPYLSDKSAFIVAKKREWALLHDEKPGDEPMNNITRWSIPFLLTTRSRGTSMEQTGCDFRRGFIYKVWDTLDNLLAYVPTLLEDDPIECVQVKAKKPQVTEGGSARWFDLAGAPTHEVATASHLHHLPGVIYERVLADSRQKMAYDYRPDFARNVYFDNAEIAKAVLNDAVMAECKARHAKNNEPVMVYPCSWCTKWRIVQKGNHHPWCGCGSDEFDWTVGHREMPRAEAEEIVARGNR